MPPLQSNQCHLRRNQPNNMALFKRGSIWWYEFLFAGRRIRESAKTGSKTVAKLAEQNRRRELEGGFNGIQDKREERIRNITEMGRCPQCGYSGSFFERIIESNAFAEIAASAKRAPTTVTELQRAIDRSWPGLLDDAAILCLCEADPTIELRAINCPKCGHQWLSTRTHAESP